MKEDKDRKTKAVSGRKAVLYARVSSKEQEKEGFSIPAQRKLLREYAGKNDIVIDKELTDVETAKAAGRTSFGEMVRYIKSNPKVGIILVEKTDRLYRNFRDYILLEDLDVEIHLVKENEVISQNSRSHAKFIHGIKVLMAKNFIDNLSEEVRKGLLEKAERGDWPHQPPLGYFNNRATRLVEVDRDKAPFIKRLFELYSTGLYSISHARDILHEEGLRSRTGKKLIKSVVDNMLKNPFYYGEFKYHGSLYQGNHEPIISRELYLRVQEVLRSTNRSRPQKRHFTFQGLIRCGRCGCMITAEAKKGKYIYYHCTHAHGNCHQPYIRERVLDRQFADALLAIRPDDDAANWITDCLERSSSQEELDRKADLKRLKQRYDKLQMMMEKSYEDRLSGVIDEGHWLSLSAKWRAELDRVRAQIDRHQGSGSDWIGESRRIIELAQRAHSLYLEQNAAEKRKLLFNLLSNSTLDDLTLYPAYTKPFDLFAEGVRIETKLPERNEQHGCFDVFSFSRR